MTQNRGALSSGTTGQGRHASQESQSNSSNCPSGSPIARPSDQVDLLRLGPTHGWRPSSLARLVSTTSGSRSTVNPHSCLVNRPRYRGFAGAGRPQTARLGRGHRNRQTHPDAGQIHLARRLHEFDFPLVPVAASGIRDSDGAYRLFGFQAGKGLGRRRNGRRPFLPSEVPTAATYPDQGPSPTLPKNAFTLPRFAPTRSAISGHCVTPRRRRRRRRHR